MALSMDELQLWMDGLATEEPYNDPKTSLDWRFVVDELNPRLEKALCTPLDTGTGDEQNRSFQLSNGDGAVLSWRVFQLKNKVNETFLCDLSDQYWFDYFFAYKGQFPTARGAKWPFFVQLGDVYQHLFPEAKNPFRFYPFITKVKKPEKPSRAGRKGLPKKQSKAENAETTTLCRHEGCEKPGKWRFQPSPGTQVDDARFCRTHKMDGMKTAIMWEGVKAAGNKNKPAGKKNQPVVVKAKGKPTADDGPTRTLKRKSATAPDVEPKKKKGKDT